MLNPPRLAWADSFRGVAIILVVVGHVIGGLHTSGIIPDSDAFHYAYHWIYAFHMPAFFFVAGVFAPQSMRRGLSAFLRDKAGLLLYPYVIWGLIHWSVGLLARGHVNSTPDLYLPLRMLITLTNGLWFFYVLFLLMAVFGFSSWLKWSRLSFLVAALIAFCLGSAQVFAFWAPLDAAARSAPYLAIGVAFAERFKAWPGQATPLALFLASIPTMAAMSCLVPVEKPENPWMILLRASLGTTSLFGLAAFLSRVGEVAFLQECGKRSLEIYVVHALPSVAARLLLSKLFGIQWIWLHVLAGVALGVLGSIAFARLCDWLGWRHVFSWGQTRGPNRSAGMEERPTAQSVVVEAGSNHNGQ